MLAAGYALFSRLALAGVLFTLAVSIQITGSGGASASNETNISSCKPGKFDSGNFSDSTTIDNEQLPLVPGTKMVLQGMANRGGGLTDHRVEFVVTDMTKVVNGVSSVVLWDRDFNGSVLAEAELTFHAQDDDGNVWNLGEYPEEYENGVFIGAPSTWIAGLAKARSGLAMPADPEDGKQAYLQAKAPGIIWDCGQLLNTGVATCVPVACYEDVLVVDEWSPDDREGGHQQKFHAPGVGVVQVGAVDDPEGETLVLVEYKNLTPAEMAEARAAVRALEERAYEVSEIYAETEPAE